MDSELKVGLICNKELIVSLKDTAKAYGSGTAQVFATPAMIGLMEGAALEAVGPYLAQGLTTVGILVNVKHSSATAVGKRVRAEAKLVEIDRKRLVFEVKAYDEDKQIGEGIHERFIVDEAKFMAKLDKDKEG